VSPEPATATVFENGWCSFSPSGFYGADGTSPRAKRDLWPTTRRLLRRSTTVPLVGS